jgi:two-component system OmpR family sensor kinase
VLDRFYRVAGVETTGSGLGLAIVKSIAELHGATLSLDTSRLLGGLRVELAFPKA